MDAPIILSASQKNQIKTWWKKVKLNNPNFQDLKMSAVGNIIHSYFIDNNHDILFFYRG